MLLEEAGSESIMVSMIDVFVACATALSSCLDLPLAASRENKEIEAQNPSVKVWLMRCNDHEAKHLSQRR